MGGLKYPIKSVFNGEFSPPLAQAWQGSVKDKHSSSRDEFQSFSISCLPGLGTRRLILFNDGQASCCSSSPLLGGFECCDLGTSHHIHVCCADLVSLWLPNN